MGLGLGPRMGRGPSVVVAALAGQEEHVQKALLSFYCTSGNLFRLGPRQA